MNTAEALDTTEQEAYARHARIMASLDDEPYPEVRVRIARRAADQLDDTLLTVNRVRVLLGLAPDPALRRHR